MKQVSLGTRVGDNARSFVQFTASNPCFFGMGFYYAWLYLSFYSPSLFPRAARTFFLVDAAWACGAWGFAVFLVLYLLLFRKILCFCPRRILLRIAFIATSAGTAVALLPTMLATVGIGFPPETSGPFDPDGIFAAVGMVISGIASAGIILLWGSAYQKLNAREILGVASGSMVVGALIFAVAVNLPSAFISLLLVCFPLASEVCLERCDNEATLAQSGTEPLRQAKGQNACIRESPTSNTAPKKPRIFAVFSLRLFIPFAALFAFALGGEVLRSLCTALDESSAFSAGLHNSYIASQGIGGGIWLVFAFVISESSRLETTALKLARPAFIAMAVAFAALCLLPLSPSTSYGIFGLGFQYVRVFAFAIAIDSSKRCPFTAASAVAFVHLPAALAPCVSPVLLPVAEAFAHNGIVNWNIVFMISTCAMFVTALFVLNEKDFLTVWGVLDEPLPAKERVIVEHSTPSGLCDEDWFRGLAAAWNLTKRETEVALLLARGRNLPYIEEKLMISHGTAQTHQRHIYEKAQVHSRQEFLDLVERGSNALSAERD